MKKEIIFNKLVRDNMLQIISDNKQEYSYHIANIEEYKIKLLEKLQEEIQEFIIERNEEELGDVFEVIEHIIINFNLNKENILKMKEKKAQKRGKFNNRIILESVYDLK